MNVYLNSITGWDDAILSMYYSKRTITRKLEDEVRAEVEQFTSRNGQILSRKEVEALTDPDCYMLDVYDKFIDRIHKLLKWCPVHITLGRFINLSFTVYGLHRGAQDDFDSHAKRLDNRIIRSSTRLAKFEGGEKSEFYEDKIVTAEEAIKLLYGELPPKMEYDGKTYVKAPNGYVLEKYAGNQDVERGLYMLSIPSNFIAQCNLTEFSHIYKERGAHGNAAPELKQMIESLVDQLETMTNGLVNRELFMNIKN